MPLFEKNYEIHRFVSSGAIPADIQKEITALLRRLYECCERVQWVGIAANMAGAGKDTFAFFLGAQYNKRSRDRLCLTIPLSGCIFSCMQQKRPDIYALVQANKHNARPYVSPFSCNELLANPYCWIVLALRTAVERLEALGRFFKEVVLVFTGIRTPHDTGILQMLGGFLIRMEADPEMVKLRYPGSLDAFAALGQDPLEFMLDELPAEVWTAVYRNDGKKRDLRAKARRFINRYLFAPPPRNRRRLAALIDWLSPVTTGQPCPV